MVERFLRYSLAHNKPIRVVDADTLKCRNITVITLDGQQVTFLTARRKTPETKPIGAFLSASYARGDDGDTLKYAGMNGRGEENRG